MRWKKGREEEDLERKKKERENERTEQAGSDRMIAFQKCGPIEKRKYLINSLVKAEVDE